MLRNFTSCGSVCGDFFRSLRGSQQCGLSRNAKFSGAMPVVLALFFSQLAWAQGPIADLEGMVLRIGGSAITGTSAIPAGRSLTPTLLATSDPETSDGDGLTLGGARPGFRVRGGASVPGTPAEQVTFRINGAIVANSVPDMRATLLQTDAGPITAVVFTAGGTTYAIPRGEFSTPTRTVAQSAVNTTTVSTLFTYQYGLLPARALPQVGAAFANAFSFNLPQGSGTQRFTVLDADDIRGNADSTSEELVFPGEPARNYTRTLGTQGIEVNAIARLSDGTLVEVLGLRFTRTGAYSYVENTWLLDRAGLAAAGATIDDVTDILLDEPAEHDLSWQDLGFDVE